MNIMLISSYLRGYQEKILNMQSRKHKSRGAANAFPMYKFLTKDQSDTLVKILIKFYTDTALDIFKTQQDLFLEHKNKYEINLKKIDRGSQDEFLAQKEQFSTFVWHMETLADLLDQDLPNYKDDLEKVEGEAEEIKLTEEELKYWPYENYTEMKFYKILPAFENAPREQNDEEEEGEGNEYDPFNKFCFSLLECSNQIQIDDKSLEFISKFNTKYNRKKLAKFMFSKSAQSNVKFHIKTSPLLIKMLSRMVATLTQKYKEVKNELVKMLVKEHSELIKSQDIMSIQIKLKNIKFIGELTKFNLCDSEIVLTRFKECLEDLKMHNPEILFHLVDICGRFLMKKEKMEGFTKLSFNNMLDKLWEIRSQSILSEISIQYVENSYFYCRPSESASLNKESELTEEEQHIHHLLFEKLNERTAELVAKDLKSIDLKTNEEFLVDSIIRLANIGTFSDLDTV
jgi:hypothetical protein